MGCLRLFFAFAIFQLTAGGFFSKICGFGRTGLNSIINGEFYANETDPANDNKPIWYSSDNTEDITIEWGAAYYGASFTHYAFKSGSGGRYGYCSIANATPTDCDGNWLIYNGTHEALDPQFVMYNCSYFYSRTNNCSDESYLISIGITPFNHTCISNLTYQTHLEGTYYHNNVCLQGLPVYNYTNSRFLYYLFASGRWHISNTIGDHSAWAVCDEKD